MDLWGIWLNVLIALNFVSALLHVWCFLWALSIARRLHGELGYVLARTIAIVVGTIALTRIINFSVILGIVGDAEAEHLLVWGIISQLITLSAATYAVVRIKMLDQTE